MLAPSCRGWRRTISASATGSASARTSPSASGARCARTTRRTGPAGTTSRTTTRAAAPTAGARTACSGSAIARAGSASRWRSGTARDPILKERLFGLTGPEGNHGEDVKEQYFYLDSTPTHSYMKALYKYPQREFPYARLVEENRRRGKDEPEFELADTGVFDDGRYFDVFAEYAKASPDDMLIAITVANRGPGRGAARRAADALVPQHLVLGTHRRGLLGAADARARRGGDGDDRGRARVARAATGSSVDRDPTAGGAPELLFTENETNTERLFGIAQRHALREGRVPRVRRRGPRRSREPRASRHEGGGALSPDRARRRRGPAAPAAHRRPRRSRATGRAFARLRRGLRRAARRGRRVLSRRRPGRCRPTSDWPCARPTRGCSGRSSSITTTCAPGSRAIRRSRRRRRAAAPAATPSGATSTTATSSRCRTSGSTRGSPRGISRST